MAVSAPERRHARPLRHVLEGAIPLVSEQPVAVLRSRLAPRKRPSLYEVDVEPAVAVKVEEPDPTSHRLGRRGLLPRVAVVVNKAEANRGRVVSELGNNVSVTGPDCVGRRRRGSYVGEKLRERQSGSHLDLLIPQRVLHDHHGRPRRATSRGPPPSVQGRWRASPARRPSRPGRRGRSICDVLRRSRRSMMLGLAGRRKRSASATVAPGQSELGEPIQGGGVAGLVGHQGINGCSLSRRAASPTCLANQTRSRQVVRLSESAQVPAGDPST